MVGLVAFLTEHRKSGGLVPFTLILLITTLLLPENSLEKGIGNKKAPYSTISKYDSLQM